jgi:hypothetical protein
VTAWSGRIALDALAYDPVTATRETFLARHQKPFLMQLEADVATPSSNQFHTLVVASPRLAGVTPHGPVRLAYELRKRPGSNAFTMMVTLGRAPNNDIVLAADAVSKFHASFVETPTGWTITDASTNGTWLDGERLEARRPAPLRPGALVDLSRAVRLMFITPEQAWNEVRRVRERLLATG